MTNEVYKIGELILACKTTAELSNVEYRLREDYPEYLDDIYDYARWQYYNIKERGEI